MTVDTIGFFHGVELSTVFGENRAAVGDTRIAYQAIKIFPRRPGELGLRVQEVHDPQVGRDVRQQLIEHRSRHIAALRQRPDLFEALAEIRGGSADGGRLHQRMTGRTVFAGPFPWRIRSRRLGGRHRGRRAWRGEPGADIELRGGGVDACDQRQIQRYRGGSEHCPRLDHARHSAPLRPWITSNARPLMLYGCGAIKAQSTGLLHAPLTSSGVEPLAS